MACMLAGCCFRISAAEPGFLDSAQKTADFASFCQFVEDEYAYFDVKKTDWARACKRYALQAPDTAGRDAFTELLERALSELYDHHAHLGTNTHQSYRLVPTQADLFATWTQGRPTISEVRSGTAAQLAGVTAGMEVVQINGEATHSVVRSIEPATLSQPDPAARDWALQVALAGRRHLGTVRLLTRTGDQLREIEFVPLHPQASALLAHRMIAEVGYVRLNNSLGQQALVHAFDKALAELPSAKALVIDLRDTPSGGNSLVARGIMGRLVASMQAYQRHELVSEFRSTGVRRIWDEYVVPRDLPFLKPVVVLVGRWTGSMGEGLAIGLNAIRGAPVLGQPMAHLLGANGEIVLPHSKIVVRIPTEKLFHIDGTPREAFVPTAITPVQSTRITSDFELDAAVERAQRLSR